MSNLQPFYDHLAELYHLDSILALLNWDLQVNLPPDAAPGRAKQIEYLSVLRHAKATDAAFYGTVKDLAARAASLGEDDAVNAREIHRTLSREARLPAEFIAEKSRAHSEAFVAWVKARPANDWNAVQPLLHRVVDLARREAELLGYEEHPYNAHLEYFEPYSRLSKIKPLLLDLGEKLTALAPQIAKQFAGLAPLQGNFPPDGQRAVLAKVIPALGLRPSISRLDVSAHPFMTSVGPKDIRITTRFHSDNFLPALYGVIHESGHGLYELQLPDRWKGTPRGSPVSMSIHESQSRLWENMVGRSREFMEFLHPLLTAAFSGVPSVGELWRHANVVQPSLIRVEADEVTYGLHIVIRMKLEEQLITGALPVADLPEAWAAEYERHLGIRPPSYTDGVMQDVHWFQGAIGYFPSYALGNLYAAMLLEDYQATQSGWAGDWRAGNYQGLLNYLDGKVHSLGMKYTSEQLIVQAMGRELSADSFIRYLKSKYSL